MAVATFLIFNARYMGRKFDEYMESGYVVGAGDNEEDGGGGGGGDGGDYAGISKTGGVEMASVQNDENDTSCALPEDDTELGDEINDSSPEESDDDDDDDDGAEAAATETATPMNESGAGKKKKKRRGKRQHGIAAIEQV